MMIGVDYMESDFTDEELKNIECVCCKLGLTHKELLAFVDEHKNNTFQEWLNRMALCIKKKIVMESRTYNGHPVVTKRMNNSMIICNFNTVENIDIDIFCKCDNSAVSVSHFSFIKYPTKQEIKMITRLPYVLNVKCYKHGLLDRDIKEGSVVKLYNTTFRVQQIIGDILHLVRVMNTTAHDKCMKFLAALFQSNKNDIKILLSECEKEQIYQEYSMYLGI